MNKDKATILFAILLTCFSLFGQVNKQEVLLLDYLEEIEKKHACSFSYADETIANITIKAPRNSANLKSVIAYLNKNTRLLFSFINNNSIVISRREKGKICGYFLDYETGEPIESVTVVSGEQSTITNYEGYFELNNVNFESLIAVRHLSYKAIRYLGSQFGINSCHSYYLVPRVEHMSEIVIRNYLTKGIRKTITGNFNIDYKNFGTLPGLIEPDVLKTLQSLPGIQSVDERVSNLTIRGGTHHENFLEWDGIKMYQSGHFFGLISAFNPYLTKKVVFTKNGTTADLSEGVSGSIQMFTDDKLNSTMAAAIGFNLINSDAYIDLPISEKASVQLSARKSINNWIETPTYSAYFDNAFQNSEVVNNADNVLNSNSDFSFYDINLRALYQLSDYDKLRINLLTFDNRLLFLENAIVRGVEESRQSSADQKTLAAGINYERIWSDRFSSELQLYATSYDLKSTNADIINSQRLKQENEVIEESIKLDTKWEIAERFHMYNGYHFRETGVANIQDVDNPLFKSTIKEVIRSHGLWSRFEYQSKNRRSHLNLGLRLNYLEKFGTFFTEPRLGFYQKITPHFYIEVLGEMKHQYTTQVVDFQNDFLGVENRRWLLSNNKDIPIIKSKQLSNGYHFKKGGWLISAEAFYKEVDGITSQSQGFLNQYQFVKTTGSYRIYGADFLLNRQIANLSTWLSYSYWVNEYKFLNLEESNFSNNLDIRNSLSFGLSFTSNITKISFGLNWHSGVPTTLPVVGNEVVDGEINWQDANGSRLEDYMRADISAQFNFKLGKKIKAQAGIAVWNLLKMENETNKYYLLSNSEATEIVRHSLGLTPNVSLRLWF